MIVSVGPGAPASPDDRARFGARPAVGAPLTRPHRYCRRKRCGISGLPGFEIRATAKDLRGEPVKLVQWVRFGASGFCASSASVAPDDWDKLFNRFRAVRDGIELR